MRVRRRDTRIWFLALAVFSAVFLFSFLRQNFEGSEADVEAVSLANFDPGYIISDYQMGNYNSMSEDEIQTFLTKKGPCNNTDEVTYNSLVARYPNLGWHFENGHFVCLSEELFGDGEVIGEGETAAHIIWQAAQDYEINPQVLMVLLQKEQGLITDNYPNSRQYRAATGYGCPDTAACSSKYYGFKNQVRNAAAMFRAVLNGGWTNYPLGENYIQYNPNADCGGSIVNVRNLATSALYRYTPYQPNAGALAAGYSTAYCGSYGNRNFYLYFEDWFSGITLENPTIASEWKEMVMPRTMVVEKDTMKIDPMKLGFYNDEKAKIGEKYHFASKIDIVWNGRQEVCLRTIEDTKSEIDRCIIMSRMVESDDLLYVVEEIDAVQLGVVRDTAKYDLKTGKKVQEIKMRDYNRISFVAKTEYNGKEYYQTAYDWARGNEYFIPVDDLDLVVFVAFLRPRNMKTKSVAEYINLGTNEVCLSVEKGYTKKYTTKTELDGKVYFRTDEDTEEESMCAILSEKVEDASGWDILADKIKFDDFLYPRELKFKNSSYSVNLEDGTSCKEYYKKGENIKFTTKVTMNNIVYYRTEKETDGGLNCAVKNAELSEI